VWGWGPAGPQGFILVRCTLLPQESLPSRETETLPGVDQVVYSSILNSRGREDLRSSIAGGRSEESPGPVDRERPGETTRKLWLILNEWGRPSPPEGWWASRWPYGPRGMKPNPPWGDKRLRRRSRTTVRGREESKPLLIRESGDICYHISAVKLTARNTRHTTAPGRGRACRSVGNLDLR